ANDNSPPEWGRTHPAGRHSVSNLRSLSCSVDHPNPPPATGRQGRNPVARHNQSRFPVATSAAHTARAVESDPALRADGDLPPGLGTYHHRSRPGPPRAPRGKEPDGTRLGLAS